MSDSKKSFENNKDSINSVNETITLHRDIYSSGQIESKLWLCREIEKRLHNQDAQTVWVLGGWAGLLSFLLLSRENLNIKSIHSFDLEPNSEKKANIINENWIWRDQKFKAKTIDCNHLDYKNTSFADSDEPSLIINTSVEHFNSKKWYENIPSGKMVALQSCDLQHKEHTFCVHSEEEFKNHFKFTKLYFSGSLHFDYKTSSFSRYMLIFEK